MGEFSHASNLTFSWNFTSVDETSIKITIYPNHPADVSAHSSPEKVRVIFHDKQMFRGKNNRVLVTNSTTARIPSLIVFPAFEEVVETVTEVLAKATVIFTIAEFVLNSGLGYSLAIMWTFLNMLQLIVFLPLVNAEFPRNALDFNKAFVTIASFDMLPMSDLYESALSFGPQTAFSSNFEELGMETHNLIFNMGFVFLYFPFFALFLTALLFAWICKYYNGADERVEDRVEPYSTRPKTRSSRCFNWLRDFMFWNTTIRFFLEGYIDFALVSLVQFYDMRLI